MICLGFDTALGACSAAIVEDGRVLAAERMSMRAGQAEALAPMVERVMRQANLAFPALDRIAVTTGPGTFTGQRIGLAFARGLALALKIPCVGVTTLEALAAAAAARHPGAPVLAAIDARRGELYVQAFDAARSPIGEPAVATHEGAAALAAPHAVLTGSGAAILGPLCPGAVLDDDSEPDAAVVAALGSTRPPAERPPAPFYLRAADAKLPGPLKPLPAARPR